MIYDTFLYNGEREVLEVRVAEWADANVMHMAIESNVTFAGESRGGRFLSGVEAYRGVWHYTCPDPPEGLDPFEREDHQRNYAETALRLAGASEDDVVIFGDVDEIPSAGALQAAATMPGLTAVRAPYHSLLAVWRLPLEQDVWHHRFPIVGRFRDILAAGGFAAARAGAMQLPWLEGGWHLSSMGGPAALEKFVAFAHHAEPWVERTDLDALRAHARTGTDILDRFTMERVPLEQLPRAIRDDPERYRSLLEVTW